MVTFTRIIGTSLKFASLHRRGYYGFSECRNYPGIPPRMKKAQKKNPFFTGNAMITQHFRGVNNYFSIS